MDKKPIHKSKTINFGLALALFGAAQAGLPAVKESIPPDAYGWIFFGVGIVVSYLRYVTTQPIQK